METVAASPSALPLADEPVGFSSLPDELAKKIFLGLPLDTRLRAREVSPAWCTLLEDVRFWQSFPGAEAERLTVALTWGLVCAACARAKGTLRSLNLYSVRDVPLAALEELMAKNGESLRFLWVPNSLVLEAENVARVRQAAPLCQLNCAVQCEGAEAVALLRCELVCPFHLRVYNLNTQQQQTDFATALASRTGIRVLNLVDGDLAGGAALEKLANAVVAVGVRGIIFSQCGLTPMALPALTLLLRSKALRSLLCTTFDVPFLTGPNLPAFCDALRSNASLDQIALHNCDLWADPAAAGMVLAALAARSTRFSLSLIGNRVGETQAQQFAAGTQLAQLITVGGLNDLLLKQCSLGEVGLAPIFEALPQVTRLSKLGVVGEVMSREFARDVVLPAVRATTSLQELKFLNEDEDVLLLPELIEAQNIVKARL